MLKAFMCCLCSMTILLSSINVQAFTENEIIGYMQKTVNETTSEAVEKLGNDIVFMTSNGSFFAGGEKLLYSDFGENAYVSNGKIMVDTKVLAYVFGKGSIIDGKFLIDNKEFEVAEKNNAYFSDVAAIGRELSKYVYDTDNREFILISDSERGYTNSIASQDNQEPIDVIWRYMQFDRPTGEKIYDDLVSNKQYQQHPRLFVKKDEIPVLKSRIESDVSMKKIKEELLNECDGYIEQDPIERVVDAAGIRIFSSCVAVKERLIKLCTAYLLTDETKYAERAWEELDSACNWTDWNLDTHFLDSGEIGTGIAYAYDVLYNYLDTTQKESVRNRVEALYLDFCVGAYSENKGYNVRNYRNVACNWGAVCATSMFMVSLTFMDEESEGSVLTQKCKYIASNALQTLEHIFTAITPEGAWHEGMGYYEYVLQHTAWSLAVMENALGSSYNFLSTPGLSKLADYIIYNQTINGVFNKGATTKTPILFAPEAMLYAKLFDDADKMKFYNNYYKSIGIYSFPEDYLLFFDPTIDGNEAECNLSLDNYYESSGTGIIRESWTNPECLYTAVSGGIDGHYDKGSFIFESLGERWIVDIGRNGSSTMYFLDRADVHSTLVINPTADHKGQASDKWAGVVRRESKPKGSIMIYDLADVYNEWVDSYNRGFLVSDDRMTLTVRDELKLKEESDLQWNLITRADIEISADGKSATLLQNGKKVRVTAYCSEDNWSFQKTDDVAPTGGWVDGEASDKAGNITYTTEEQKQFAGNAKRLMITAKGIGNVEMTFKIAPEIDGEDFEEVQNISLSKWTIPDGPKQEIVRLIDIKNNDIFYSDTPGMFSCIIDGEFKKVTVFANGIAVDSVTDKSSDSKYKFAIPKGAMNCAGDMDVDICAEYEEYSAKKRVTINVIKEYENKEQKLVDFSQYPDNEADSEKVRKALGLRYISLKDGYGEISKAEGSDGVCMKMRVVKSKAGESGVPYIQLENTLTDSSLVNISFDVLTNENDMSIYATFGEYQDIFNTNGTFLEGTVSYETNKWYKVKIVADTLSGQCRTVILDTKGNVIATQTILSEDNICYDGKIRLSFRAANGDEGYFLIDNLEIYSTKYLQVKTEELSADNSMLYLKQNILSNFFVVDELQHIVSFFSKDKLCDNNAVYISAAKEDISSTLDVPVDAETVKIMLWTQDMVPVMNCKKLLINKEN